MLVRPLRHRGGQQRVRELILETYGFRSPPGSAPRTTAGGWRWVTFSFERGTAVIGDVIESGNSSRRPSPSPLRAASWRRTLWDDTALRRDVGR